MGGGKGHGAQCDIPGHYFYQMADHQKKQYWRGFVNERFILFRKD